MNTQDIDIELPPLPKGEYRLSPDSRVPTLYDEEAMESYARSAIEADRKRRGESVAKVRNRGFEVVDGKHVPTVLVEFPVDDWESRDRFADAVDSSHPAGPVQLRLETLSEHIARDMREGRFPGKSERKMVPAELVKVPS